MENPFELIMAALRDIQSEIKELKEGRKDKNGMDTVEYMTVLKVAEYLDCTQDHVYHLKARIPFCNIGGRLYFKKQDIINYIESGKREPVRAQGIPSQLKRYRMTKKS